MRCAADMASHKDPTDGANSAPKSVSFAKNEDAPQPDDVKPFGATLEKAAKYTKKWKKCYVMFDPADRLLSYGESADKPAKHTMMLRNITRNAETNPKLIPGDPDLFSFTCELKWDTAEEQWQFRCPDDHTLRHWYHALRKHLAAAGQMDSFDCGLPVRDPRNNLHLAAVPTEFLNGFALLDRAIMYHFEKVCALASNGIDMGEEILVIGDRCLYLFKLSADVHRCVQLKHIKKAHQGSDSLGLQCTGAEHDILLTNCASASTLIHVIRTAQGPDLALKASEQPLPAEEIAKLLSTTPKSKYELSVVAPTPKIKLRNAMDDYKRQTGQEFVFVSPEELARQEQIEAEEAEAAEAQSRPTDGAASAPKSPSAPAKKLDPLEELLHEIGLPMYLTTLRNALVDLDMLSVMEEADLVGMVGITDTIHRKMILAAAKGEPWEQLSQQHADLLRATEAFMRQTTQGSTLSWFKRWQQNAQAKRATRLRAQGLDDDLDVDVAVSKPKPAVKKATIMLSSDDDDDVGLILPSAKADPVSVSLSDDDDVAVPATAKAGIDLSDSDESI